MAAGNGTEGRRNFTCISFHSNGNAVALYAEYLGTANHQLYKTHKFRLQLFVYLKPALKTQPTNLFDSTTLHNDNIKRQLKILGTSAIKCANTLRAAALELETMPLSYELQHFPINSRDCVLFQVIKQSVQQLHITQLPTTHILVYTGPI